MIESVGHKTYEHVTPDCANLQLIRYLGDTSLQAHFRVALSLSI